MQKRSQTATRRGARASASRTGRRTTAKARTPTRAGRTSSRMTESRRRATVPRSRRASTPARGGGRTRLSANTTTDHDEIRRWAEERQGTPATVARTNRPGQQSSILRIDFPGFSGKGTLKPIEWDEWFRQFEERKLAFLHQDRAANGELSRFFKLIRRTK